VHRLFQLFTLVLTQIDHESYLFFSCFYRLVTIATNLSSRSVYYQVYQEPPNHVVNGVSRLHFGGSGPQKALDSTFCQIVCYAHCVVIKASEKV